MTSITETESIDTCLKQSARNSGMGDVRRRDLEIPATDGYRLAATAFEHVDRSRETPLVIVSPATSVPRRFYTRFASDLAARGFDVITYDYRGIGESRPLALRGFPARMSDWGEKDFEGVLRHAHDVLRRDRVRVVGHSVGGQLLGLAASNAMVERAVCMGSQLGDFRLWPLAQRPRMLAIWYGVIPLANAVFGYVPGKLGIGEDLPAGIAAEWRDWCLTKGYFFGKEDGDERRAGYARIDADLLAISVQRDPFAPRASVDAWAHAFPSARLTREHIEDTRLGHFGYFRESAKGHWARAADFLAR